MKINGFVGKGSGKLGASVWVVRKGQQIVREYVSHVNDPKSVSQTRQRAKFKLISQITALLAPILQNRPKDSESIRNAFARENAIAFTWDSTNSKAVVNMLGLSITSSSLGLPLIKPLVAANPLPVGLGSRPQESVDAVFYAGFTGINDKYEYIGSILVDEPGANGHYDGELIWPATTYPGIVFAYGVKWASEDVRAIYENYKASEPHAASLVLQLLRNPSNATMTMTRTREVTVQS